MYQPYQPIPIDELTEEVKEYLFKCNYLLENNKKNYGLINYINNLGSKVRNSNKITPELKSNVDLLMLFPDKFTSMYNDDTYKSYNVMAMTGPSGYTKFN